MSAGQGETAEQERSAESLRDVRARAKASLADFTASRESAKVNTDGLVCACFDEQEALARDAIALTLSVERLLVRVREADEAVDELATELAEERTLHQETLRRVRELTDARDNAVHGRDLARLDVERERQETTDALRRVQEAERARLSALASVASVLNAQGDDAPSALVDAHRVLATGLADEDRAVLGGNGQHEPKEDTNG